MCEYVSEAEEQTLNPSDCVTGRDKASKTRLQVQVHLTKSSPQGIDLLLLALDHCIIVRLWTTTSSKPTQRQDRATVAQTKQQWHKATVAQSNSGTDWHKATVAQSNSGTKRQWHRQRV